MEAQDSALLIIDMINTFDFEDGEKLFIRALPVAHNIIEIKKKLKCPVIYVNDNFGLWRSSWKEVFEHCRQPCFRGHEIAQLLKPADEDYFILKPKHSAFYQTALETLLKELKVKRLIITGVAGNICVLFTAHDGHMRGYEIHVPGNGIASNNKEDDEFTLYQLSRVFGIETKDV
jgi:nicotinamidase-related amidase